MIQCKNGDWVQPEYIAVERSAQGGWEVRIGVGRYETREQFSVKAEAEFRRDELAAQVNALRSGPVAKELVSYASKILPSKTHMMEMEVLEHPEPVPAKQPTVDVGRKAVISAAVKASMKHGDIDWQEYDRRVAHLYSEDVASDPAPESSSGYKYGGQL